MEAAGTFRRIVRLLDESGVSYIIHDYGEVGVDDVKRNAPFPVDSLVKTLVFRVDQSWVLAAVRAKDRVDYRKLADACGVSRSAISAPSSQEIEAALGVEVGGVPPLRLNDQVRVIFDQNVLGSEVVYCGAAKLGKTLEIRAEDLLNLASAEIAAIVRE